MKRKTQKKKPVKTSVKRLIARELFSLGDMAIRESVGIVGYGTDELLGVRSKKK